MLISYFHIFQRGFEVLNTIIQISVYATIATAIVYYNMYQYQKDLWNFISSWIVNIY